MRKLGEVGERYQRLGKDLNVGGLKGEAGQPLDLQALPGEAVKFRLAVDGARESPLADLQARLNEFPQGRAPVCARPSPSTARAKAVPQP